MEAETEIAQRAAEQLVRVTGVLYGTVTVLVENGRACAVRDEHSVRVENLEQPHPQPAPIELVLALGQVLRDYHRVDAGTISLTVHEGRVTHHRPGYLRAPA